MTAGFNFDEADMVPAAKFHQIVWKGLTSKKPFKVNGAEQDDDDDKGALAAKTVSRK